ncbi:MAG: hypothetical protein LBJ02_05530 [Bifidobacteriaceae bacterium]|jgi:hypothetical protein|nr:hypothetical protein [Bifidobacteriaceae bacterium]
MALLVAAAAVAAGVTLLVLNRDNDSEGRDHAAAPPPSKSAMSASSSLTPVADLSRDNSAATQADLQAGTYTVGAEIPAGRYIITTDTADTGNLHIDSATGPFKCNELLGVGEFNLGVASYTTDLDAGDTISWLGDAPITLTPAPTEVRTELTAGNWIVGLDIPAGEYLATANGDWSGNLRIYSADGQNLLNQVVEPSSEPQPIPVSLVAGQRVDVSGVASFTFAPK